MNILHITKTSGYPIPLITKLNTQIEHKLSKPNMTNDYPNSLQIWITFTFNSPVIRKITNLFQDTNLKIAFRTSNFIHNILNTRIHNKNRYTDRGIYQIICYIFHYIFIRETDHNWSSDTRNTYDVSQTIVHNPHKPTKSYRTHMTTAQ
jgi:hypothetical protein